MWYEEDLTKILGDFELGHYRNLFVHVNLGLSGICGTNPSKPHAVFLDTLQKLNRNRSNVFLPAFTYSFGHGGIFRPYSDSGLKAMGLVSQLAWERGYSRTLDPMLSLLGFGKNIYEFTSKPSVNSSHGAGSIFARLVDENTGLILVNVGCATTLLHELEYRFSVNYRFLKEFEGYSQFKPTHSPEFTRWTAFVNRRDIPNSEADFSNLNRDLFHDATIKRVKFGKGYIVHLDTNFLTTFLKSKLEFNPWYLTKRGHLNSTKKDF